MKRKKQKKRRKYETDVKFYLHFYYQINEMFIKFFMMSKWLKIIGHTQKVLMLLATLIEVCP